MLPVLQCRLPPFESDQVAALAEIAPGLPTGKTAIAAPSDIPPPIDDQREPAHARRQPRRQARKARNDVAAIRPGLSDDLFGVERTLDADTALERPGCRDHGARDRSLRIRVHDFAVVRTQQIGGTDRIRTRRKRRAFDDGAATRRHRGHEQQRRTRRGPAPDKSSNDHAQPPRNPEGLPGKIRAGPVDRRGRTC